MQNKRLGMPTKKQIVIFWAETLIFYYNKYSMDIYYDSFYDNPDEVTNTCFACGSWYGTQRAHIKAVTIGGSNELSNLHLLCPECHLESEHYDNEDDYFEWFKYKDSSNSGSFLRILNKAKIICNSKNKII